MNYQAQVHSEITTEQRNGNLHINLEGIFTSYTAAKATFLMQKHYSGTGNIFLHTKKVSQVSEAAKPVFKTLMDSGDLPQENIYFTGKKGLTISSDTGKVIIWKKKKNGHSCCGKCKNCTCHTKKAA